MRFLLTLCLLFSAAIIPASALATGAHSPTVPGKLAATLDELAARFDPTVCADCHEQIYEEWSQSMHSKSFIDPRVIQTWRTFIKQGLEKEAGMTKMDMKNNCMWCHAPYIKYADDKLVSEIIDMVLTAADDPDESKRDAAVKQLSKLNLNCYGCHNLFAVKDGYWGNKPEEGAIYGPRGEDDPEEAKHEDFKTIKSDFLTTSKFCASCHHGCPDSVPFSQCPTVYSSYKQEYLDKGGKETCQDCHMKPDDPDDPKSHKFKGAHDKDFFAAAMELEIDADTTQVVSHYKNEITPTLAFNVKLTNRSGHGIPYG